MKSFWIAAAATSALAGAYLSACMAQDDSSTVPDGDWHGYSREPAGTRYSPLTEIDTRNAQDLSQAWSRQLNDGPGSNSQATPIVADGVMYLPARGNEVLALDGANGRQIWRYELPSGQLSTARGVAYWPGDGGNPARVLFTAGDRLVALDAATGRPAAGFGDNGAVEIVVPWNGVPTIYRNIAILGATTGEIPDGESGNTRAFDVRTGEKLWEFHTVPQPGELGHDTWQENGWRKRSGVNVWAWYMTLDAERGLLYMPVGGPAANYWGGDRPGNNLFANSIVAIDAASGAYRWHFQTVHHDLWDADMPSPPVLLDIERDGRTIPALAQVGKTGWMFILNRTTGEPIFGVEERPVPAGDVPDEWYAPTQPFPLKPPPLARVNFERADMVTAADTSAQHAQACQDLWDRSGGFYNAGPFTPFSFHEEGDAPRSTIQFPGGTGGVNWGGPAADPTTGLVYVNSHDTSLVGWVEPKRPGLNYGRNTDGSKQPYDRGSVDGAGPYFSFSAPLLDANGDSLVSLPCQKPPWARLIAVNANTGDIAWQVPLGVTPELPEGKRNTGRSGSAGPTVTAGGLVFVGATNDNRLRAFDSSNGRELWSVQLDWTVNANPMTYLGRDGKQYVAVMATEELLVFGL